MPVELTVADGQPDLAQELEERVSAAVQAALASEGRAELEVSVHLGDDGLLESLNRQYRGIQAPTDVLSFRLLEDGEALPPGVEAALGDVVISLPRAHQQALAYGHSLERELCYLAVHGTLHLLGHDDTEPEDAERMARLAERVLAGMGVGR